MIPLATLILLLNKKVATKPVKPPKAPDAEYMDVRTIPVLSVQRVYYNRTYSTDFLTAGVNVLMTITAVHHNFLYCTEYLTTGLHPTFLVTHTGSNPL